MTSNDVGIPPIDENPLITFALFTYNHEKYIREAINGALAQVYEPLEIIVSDDCSTDRTFEIISEICSDYKGKHRLLINRNNSNIGSRGIGGHVNKVFEMSSGELFVFAAGDDVSLPDRTLELVKSWLFSGKKSGSLHSAVIMVNGNNQVTNPLYHGSFEFGNQSIRACIRSGAKGVLGATHAVTRDVFTRFGPLNDNLMFEDRALAFRSLIIGSIGYIERPLVIYRQHDDSFTSPLNLVDSKRWNQWVDGVINSFDSFDLDYKNHYGIAASKDIIKDIERCKRLHEKTRKMVSGNIIQRGISAFLYSKEFPISRRISFILTAMHLERTLLHNTAQKIWHIFKNSITKK